MKALKIIGIAALVYAALVAAFETWLGYSQPSGPNSLVITTASEDGEERDRVVSRLESNGQLYVAANHWPRAWYRRALRNPNVQVAMGGGEKKPYLAVPVSGDERERVNSENRAGVVFRILTGFPPRRFVRLDPR